MDKTTLVEFSNRFNEWIEQHETHSNRFYLAYRKHFQSALLIKQILDECFRFIDPALQAKFSPIIENYGNSITEVGESMVSLGEDYLKASNLYLEWIRKYEEEIKEAK